MTILNRVVPALFAFLQLAVAQSMSGNATYTNPIVDGVGADP